MRFLSLLLALLMAAPSGALRLTATIGDSELLSDGALSALAVISDGVGLTLSAEGFDLDKNGESLLRARADDEGGVVACGEATAPFDVPTPGETDVWTAMEELGVLLSQWEKRREESVNLQEAGNARETCTYVLTGEEWANVWPQVSEILCRVTPSAKMLSTAQISGKGTFKRYFAKDGTAVGGYFYAAEMIVNDVKREVRLEFGRQAGKGLYVAFRCPNAKNTSNVRLVLHVQEHTGGWTLNGDLRVTGSESAHYTAEGRTDGKLKLGWTAPFLGKATAYTLTLKNEENESEFILQRGTRTLLTGKVYWEKADLPELELAANADEYAVTKALSERIISMLISEQPENGMQLIHYLAIDQLLNAQGVE